MSVFAWTYDIVQLHYLPGWIYHLWLVVVWLVSTLTDWLWEFSIKHALNVFFVFVFVVVVVVVSGPFVLRSILLLDWRRISLFPPPASSPLIRGLPSTLPVLCQPLYSVLQAWAILFYFICVNASRVLHNWMFASVLRALVRFFDTNPIGSLSCIYRCNIVWLIWIS